MCDPRHTSFLSDFDTQLFYNVRADLFLQHVHLLVREGPVHAPIHDAVAAALAAALGMLELVDLRDARQAGVQFEAREPETQQCVPVGSMSDGGARKRTMATFSTRSPATPRTIS